MNFKMNLPLQLLIVLVEFSLAYRLHQNESIVLFEENTTQQVTTLPTEEQIKIVDDSTQGSIIFEDDIHQNIASDNYTSNVTMLKANEILNLPRFEPKNAFRKNFSKIEPVEMYNSDLVETFRNSSFYNDACQYCPELRFLQHYYAKGCIALEVQDDCKPKFCPKYFICPEEKELPKNGCRYNNTLYSFGDNVPHSDPCQHCVCINSTTGPMLSCAISECFDSWNEVSSNCYRKFIDGKCCPEIVCLPDNNTIGTCQFEGKVYRMGDYFTPQDDPCFNCVCDERWNKTETPRENQCRQIECTFDQDRPEHKGCAPVYSDKSCCPIYYHCPDEALSKNEPKCYFGNKTYDIGEKIKVKQREVCLECSCLVPPEISCKHRICPISPANCTSIYIEGECCPQIDCHESSTEQLKNDKPFNDHYPEHDNWLRQCPPIDVCKYPCKLFLNDADYKAESTQKLKQDNSFPRCPECKCDAEKSSNNETWFDESASEHSTSLKINDKTLRLAKFEKALLERNGKRCPAVACQYPCYIYRVSVGDCPRCSCSNSRLSFLTNNSVRVE